MNREELRSQAAGRRNYGEAEEAKRAVWKCNFCGHDFVMETMFMRHSCKEKQRHEELRSPIGQAAFAYYQEWMRLKKLSVPPIETFAESKFYSTFVKFARHVTKVHIPNVKQFIRLMVENGDVHPQLWCRDNIYSMYLKVYDAAVDPTAQFMSSLEELEQLAFELKVDLPDVFPAIGVDTLEDLIKKRKLSHWFLLASTKFRSYLLKLDATDRDRLAAALNADAAVARVMQEQELFAELVKGAKEVGL